MHTVASLAVHSLPLLLLLFTVEPVVNLVLGSLALLGILTALFWELVGPPDWSRSQ
jgi:hypothetical protein